MMQGGLINFLQEDLIDALNYFTQVRRISKSYEVGFIINHFAELNY